MTPIRIFINYWRDDSAGHARAVYDALDRAVGGAQVFIDVDETCAGQTFADVIQRAVGESKVLLGLIGKRWLGERADMPPACAQSAVSRPRARWRDRLHDADGRRQHAARDGRIRCAMG